MFLDTKNCNIYKTHHSPLLIPLFHGSLFFQKRQPLPCFGNQSSYPPFVLLYLRKKGPTVKQHDLFLTNR